MDDNEINRAVLRDILLEEYQVLEAENALHAPPPPPPPERPSAEDIWW